MYKGPEVPESLCMEEAKNNNSVPLEHRQKEKMGECEGVIESVGSHWAGKSPKCQVRTLGWGLVKWGSTDIQEGKGHECFRFGNNLSASNVKDGFKNGGDRKGQRGCLRVETENSHHLLLSPILEGFGGPQGSPRSTWAHQPEGVCISSGSITNT